MSRLLCGVYNYLVYRLARVRASLWAPFVGRMGRRVYIMGGCRLLSPGGIEIGDHVRINHHTDLGGHGGLTIGSFVMIGPFCQVLTANHRYDDESRPMLLQGTSAEPVAIDDDVWIGSHVTILPGVRVQRGAVVGSHSVVAQNVPEYAVVGGVPARTIKYRFEQALQDRSRKIDLSLFDVP